MTIDIEPRDATTLPGGSARHRPIEPPAPITPEPARMPGRRNPKWIALGIVALCLGGLLSYVIYSRVASETAVVAVANTVYRGGLIDREDLTTITLQGTSLAQAVPARELDNLVGQRAAFDLAEGSVVVSSAVTANAVPAVGRAVVGLKLAMGRVPTSLLVPSSDLRLVALPPEDGGTDKLTGDAFIARVIDQSPGADGATILLNVDVSAAQAPTIALLAAQDRIAVVRDAGK
jgi:hypothetical protein